MAPRLPDRGDRPRDRPALRARGGRAGLGQRPSRQRLLAAAPSSTPEAAGAILVGGGIGIAPLALLRRQLLRPRRPDPGPARVPRPRALRRPRRPLRLLRGPARERGRPRRAPGLRHRPAGDDARGRRRRRRRRLRLRPPADARRRRRRCARLAGVPCELAHEAPMACGFGACYGCAVPDPAGDGYLRLCVDGPVLRAGTVEPQSTLPEGGAVGGPAPEEALATAGGGGPLRRQDPPARRRSSSAAWTLRHPVINASGTFDAIAARRVYGDALLEQFPFAAFVSKTITLEPRAGNEPQRIWETPAGMINSIGLPEPRPGGIPGRGPAAAGAAAGAADRLGDGDEPRGLRAPRRRRRGTR